jgi:hypothetical protein
MYDWKQLTVSKTEIEKKTKIWHDENCFFNGLAQALENLRQSSHLFDTFRLRHSKFYLTQ